MEWRIAIIIILASPFILWVCLGIWFTALIYFEHELKEMGMNPTDMVTGLDRLIRHTKLDTPGMLSVLDEKRNILFIDRDEREKLPPSMQNLLDTTRLPATQVSTSSVGAFFEEFRALKRG